MSEYLYLLYKKFYSDFQSFIFTNNILITASGFTIGIATNDLIQENIKLFTSLIVSIYNKISGNYNIYMGLGLSKNILLNTIINTITVLVLNISIWMITLIFTFIILEYILNNQIFGLKSTLKEGDEKDFIISKVSAKQHDIIPKDDTDLKKLKLIEKTDEIIGDKIIKNKEINKLTETVKIIDNNIKEQKNNISEKSKEIISNNMESYNNYMLFNHL
jgi:hypothetical protein